MGFLVQRVAVVVWLSRVSRLNHILWDRARKDAVAMRCGRSGHCARGVWTKKRLQPCVPRNRPASLAVGSSDDTQGND